MSKVTKNDDRQGIQVISRAASILRAMEHKPQGMSLGEIAEKVGLARSTVQRIIYTLEKERFVISASPTAKVRLGPTLVSLGSAAKVDIDRVIKPYLSELAETLDETVDLSVLDGKSVFFIDQATVETQRLKAVSVIGHSFQLHCCANGKAILASFTTKELKEFFKTPLERHTPNTIVDPEQLLEAIKQIDNEGVAFDLEEHSEGICAVGTLISDPYGRKLAISVPVPSIRFYGKEAKFTKALLATKRKIEAALGHDSTQSF